MKAMIVVLVAMAATSAGAGTITEIQTQTPVTGSQIPGMPPNIGDLQARIQQELRQPTAVMPGMPTRMPIVDETGKVKGTATIAGDKVYLRDKDEQLIATVVVDRIGRRKMYDPAGKEIQSLDWPKPAE